MHINVAAITEVAEYIAKIIINVYYLRISDNDAAHSVFGGSVGLVLEQAPAAVCDGHSWSCMLGRFTAAAGLRHELAHRPLPPLVAATGGAGSQGGFFGILRGG